jgi:carbonic anhydrase
MADDWFEKFDGTGVTGLAPNCVGRNTLRHLDTEQGADMHHFNRRSFLTAAAGLFAVANVGAHAAPGAAAAACTVYDKPRQAALTPEQALAALREGNERFAGGTPLHCDLRAEVLATSAGQAPMAAVVGCLDSRVPPEMVFDQYLGDIFVARVAGNFVNTDIIGSLEFATRLAGAKAIVVLGHNRCGAVMGAVDDAKLGNLTATLANIRPAVDKVRNVSGERKSSNVAFVQAVAEQNVRDAVAQLTSRSDVLRALVDAGQLRIAGAMYDLASGRVNWLG